MCHCLIATRIGPTNLIKIRPLYDMCGPKSTFINDTLQWSEKRTSIRLERDKERERKVKIRDYEVHNRRNVQGKKDTL